MKNQKQLLNKENWLKYLQLADEGGLTNNAKANDIVKMIEVAISVTRCCCKLKDKEKLNFDEWCNIFGYTKSNDKFTKRGINYSESNLLSLYKTEYLENL